MSTVNDTMNAALGGLGHTGSLNERWLQWLQSKGAVSTITTMALKEAMAALGHPVSGPFHANATWKEYMEAQLGYTGDYNQITKDFWESIL